MLNTYSEALTNMVQNEGLPKLFRDIFRNAYLPYRDPETLRAFLREINSFTYDHSEKLGDAFEYLLSVLGSQGTRASFAHPAISLILWSRLSTRRRTRSSWTRPAARRVF